MKEKLHLHQLVELLSKTPANAEVSFNFSDGCVDLVSIQSIDLFLMPIGLLLVVVLLLFYSTGIVP